MTRSRTYLTFTIVVALAIFAGVLLARGADANGNPLLGFEPDKPNCEAR